MDIGPQGRTNYGQNMRGRSALVMIDGVSLNSIRTISRQLDAIDPFNIERIEVLSGASSIYGGNATGGIINIITKTPSKKGISGETELGIRTGFMGKDDHDFRAAQSIAGKAKNYSVDWELPTSKTEVLMVQMKNSFLQTLPKLTFNTTNLLIS